MEKYVFNEKYFQSPEWEAYGKSINKKIEYLGEILHQNTEQLKYKRLNKKKRHFTEEDYSLIKLKFPLLLLDTDLVVKKLIKRSNLDLTPNERLVLYYMLDYLATDDKKARKESVTAKDIYDRIGDDKMNKTKISNALEKLCDKDFCEKDKADDQDQKNVSSDIQNGKRLTKEELERKMKVKYKLNITKMIEFSK